MEKGYVEEWCPVPMVRVEQRREEEEMTWEEWEGVEKEDWWGEEEE